MLTAFQSYLQTKAAITPKKVLELTAGLRTKRIRKGDELLAQGDLCSEMYFVSSGLLRSYTVDSSGKEHIVQFAPENWWTGDRNSFYHREPALFSIDAIEDSEVVLLTHAFFERIEKSAPEFHIFNSAALHNAIRQMQKRIVSLLSDTAEQRYLEFIRLYPSLNLRVPQWMIATYLGITPESLSRVRKELARRNCKPA
ncbi:MAG: Crp/Fnr family transcriptional regulator [Mucilaginibacter polytrichastri]|nr:Crp/Fnr family transcriptional regulator [Mucilaginibacter polytrichastri]